MKAKPPVSRKPNESLDNYLARLMSALYKRVVKPRGR